jgi:hypothetical protein
VTTIRTLVGGWEVEIQRYDTKTLQDGMIRVSSLPLDAKFEFKFSIPKETRELDALKEVFGCIPTLLDSAEAINRVAYASLANRLAEETA